MALQLFRTNSVDNLLSNFHFRRIHRPRDAGNFFWDMEKVTEVAFDDVNFKQLNQVLNWSQF